MMAEVKMKYLNLEMPLDLFHELRGYCVLRNKEFVELIREAISLWLVLVKADDVEIILDGKSYNVGFLKAGK